MIDLRMTNAKERQVPSTRYGALDYFPLGASTEISLQSVRTNLYERF